jgi:hypothetical protein
MVFIILKNDNILTVCDNIDCVYHHILTYIRIIIYCDKNKIDYIKNIKIVEYLNSCPINEFKLDDNLDICNEKNVKININNSILIRQKVELEVLLKKDVESEINLFFPIDNISSDDEYKIENEKIYIKQNKNIDILKDKINSEKMKLEKKNEIFESKLQKILDSNYELKLYEKELKLKKEKEEESQRKFYIDNNTYNNIIKEINDEIREDYNIPELFKDNFIIFKKIYEDNLFLNLTDTEKYYKYIETKNLLNFNNNIKTNYDDLFGNNLIYKQIYNEINNLEG